MTTPEEPLPAAVEAVRLQLQALAQAAGRPAPDLRVDPPRKQERAPSVHDGTVVVPPSLLAGGRARQLWYLAACLGRLNSPTPRQRQRLGWLLFGLAGLVYLVLLFVVAPNQPIVWLLIALLYPLGFWTARWERRAMEDAGRQILAAAGHDPAAIAREAFGDEPEPTPWQHLLSTEPSPRERIEAATRSNP